MNPMPKQANLMFISYIQPPKTLEGKGSSAKKKKHSKKANIANPGSKKCTRYS